MFLKSFIFGLLLACTFSELVEEENFDYPLDEPDKNFALYLYHNFEDEVDNQPKGGDKRVEEEFKPNYIMSDSFGEPELSNFKTEDEQKDDDLFSYFNLEKGDYYDYGDLPEIYDENVVQKNVDVEWNPVLNFDGGFISNYDKDPIVHEESEKKDFIEEEPFKEEVTNYQNGGTFVTIIRQYFLVLPKSINKENLPQVNEISYEQYSPFRVVGPLLMIFGMVLLIITLFSAMYARKRTQAILQIEHENCSGQKYNKLVEEV